MPKSQCRTHLTPLPLLAALVCVAAASAGGCAAGDEGAAVAPLYCYVGGTMRPAMEDLARRYETATGRRVEIDYGGSGENMIKAETSGKGDLYVAHDPFHGAMVRKGLARGGWLLATIRPMIAVAKGNPKGIGGLKDLARPGVRVVLTHPEYSTTGHIYRVMFRKADLAEALERNVVTRTRGGGAAANAVQLGHADAAIVWNAVIHLRRQDLDMVDIEAAYRPDPEIDAVTTATFGPIDMGRVRVTIDLLTSSTQPEAARAFAEYAASDEAEAVWRDFGFSVAEGPKHLKGPAKEGAEPRADGGRLLLYCGAGLRPAMAEVVEAFGAARGVEVETDYGGSGMTISRLRLAGRGDLFMPGDVWYVELAEKEGLVASKRMVCTFVPVILVPKGNPKGIRSLGDLARPGVRLGLGNPKACQIGRLSEKIFGKNGIDAEAIERNLVYASPTVNELGVQVQVGALDAAIVWDAVAAQYAESADVVPIAAEENLVSHVALAVLTCSENPALAEALAEFTAGPDGRAIFGKHGYRTEPLD